jgi:putative FmdB family regulatory protein
MPIYAYRCASCGHAQDVLQKMSDPLLSVCPACGAATYEKQVTAAGFQLKGSGWYVTDFRGGNTAAAKKDEATADKPADATASGDAAKPADAPAAKTEAKAADKAAEKSATPAAAPAAAPASGT